MKNRFTFKHMKSSDAIVDYAQAKIFPKVEKFSTKPVDVHTTFSVEGHQNMQIAHCSVKGGDGFNVEVEASCGDMYGSIDILCDKLEAQLKKQKEKLKKHKFSMNLKKLQPNQYISKHDCDVVPVDAADMLKYEEAKQRSFG